MPAHKGQVLSGEEQSFLECLQPAGPFGYFPVFSHILQAIFDVVLQDYTQAFQIGESSLNLRPTTLAALLVSEGLPKTHKNIEMVMCYGAGLGLSNEQTVQPFCQQLAGALAGFGYTEIKVTGADAVMYLTLTLDVK